MGSHAHVVEEAVVGNPESESTGHRLHEEAWKRLKQARSRDLDNPPAEYRENLATAFTAAGITGVVPCAHAGNVVPTAAPTLRSEDMANQASLQTLLGGGRVHVLEPGRMPKGADIAALCRF